MTKPLLFLARDLVALQHYELGAKTYLALWKACHTPKRWWLKHRVGEEMAETARQHAAFSEEIRRHAHEMATRRSWLMESALSLRVCLELHDLIEVPLPNLDEIVRGYGDQGRLSLIANDPVLLMRLAIHGFVLEGPSAPPQPFANLDIAKYGRDLATYAASAPTFRDEIHEFQTHLNDAISNKNWVLGDLVAEVLVANGVHDLVCTYIQARIRDGDPDPSHLEWLVGDLEVPAVHETFTALQAAVAPRPSWRARMILQLRKLFRGFGRTKERKWRRRGRPGF